MRLKLTIGIGLLLCCAALAQDEVLKKLQQAGGVKIATTSGDVKIRILDPTQTLPWMEFGSQTNIVFSLPASGVVPLQFGGTGVADLAALESMLGISPTNGVVAVTNGGTGATTALGARAALGLVETVTNSALASVASGLTTNILCFNGATTNQLQFAHGVLTGVVPQ